MARTSGATGRELALAERRPGRRYAVAIRLALWLGVVGPAVQGTWHETASAQQGSAVLVGRVESADSHKPIADAVVTVTSPSLQGEELAVTDETGAYRIPGLPPGTYVLRIEKENFRPYAHTAIELHVDTTIRLNASVLPDVLQAKEVVVVPRTPSVDVGSSATGMNITSDFTTRIPLSSRREGVRGALVRNGGRRGSGRDGRRLRRGRVRHDFA